MFRTLTSWQSWMLSGKCKASVHLVLHKFAAKCTYPKPLVPGRRTICIWCDVIRSILTAQWPGLIAVICHLHGSLYYTKCPCHHYAFFAHRSHVKNPLFCIVHHYFIFIPIMSSSRLFPYFHREYIFFNSIDFLNKWVFSTLCSPLTGISICLIYQQPLALLHLFSISGPPRAICSGLPHNKARWPTLAELISMMVSVLLILFKNRNNIKNLL